MHDGMAYDPIQSQDQGHGASEVPKIALFKVDNLHSTGIDHQSRTGLILIIVVRLHRSTIYVRRCGLFLQTA